MPARERARRALGWVFLTGFIFVVTKSSSRRAAECSSRAYPALWRLDTIMRVHKMSNQYVTPYEDVQDGDTITIADEGEFKEGEYGTKLVVKVALANGTQK